IPSPTGRLFGFVGRGRSNVERLAEAGVGGSWKEVFEKGAEGGGLWNGRAVAGVIGLVREGLSSSGEFVTDVSSHSALLGRLESKPPQTPNTSCSSSSSTRCSLRTLPLVILLAIEGVRLRWPYLFLHAAPIPTPDPTEEEEALRATIRSSIALS